LLQNGYKVRIYTDEKVTFSERGLGLNGLTNKNNILYKKKITIEYLKLCLKCALSAIST